MAIFLIADTHFCDDNAIEYHMRPFNDVSHMNETMVHNWNRVVSHGDTVIILGDFTGPEVTAEEASEWSALLNGNKKFIIGNNDTLSEIHMQDAELYEDKYVLQHNNQEYYCTHKPDKIPKDWRGWGIHGHSHQLHPQDYPLYDYQHKKINVSAEQIGYTPISISAITEMVEIIENH